MGIKEELREVEQSLTLKKITSKVLVEALIEKGKISEDEKDDLMKMINESVELIRQSHSIDTEFYELCESYSNRIIF